LSAPLVGSHSPYFFVSLLESWFFVKTSSKPLCVLALLRDTGLAALRPALRSLLFRETVGDSEGEEALDEPSELEEGCSDGGEDVAVDDAVGEASMLSLLKPFVSDAMG